MSKQIDQSDIKKFRLAFEKKIQQQGLPEGFYNSFKYTTTGRNLTHPITIGTLSTVLSQLFNPKYLAEDYRQNRGNGVKFQPDITLLNSLSEHSEPSLFVDYESPNSSDNRVIEKDVQRYLEFKSEANLNVPYIIILTLPKKPLGWQLRYMSKGVDKKTGKPIYGVNYSLRNKKTAIKANPQKFWINHYKNKLKGQDLRGIHFFVIDNLSVRKIKI